MPIAAARHGGSERKSMTDQVKSKNEELNMDI